uniref:G protein gamma domain-containing protein n=1 Tax=Oryctolagus cuniculus TaxID=9986 RepID=A0A5F9CNW0_RABIT
MMSASNNIAQAWKLMEQLLMETKTEVSKSLMGTGQLLQQHFWNDLLLFRVPASKNPFKGKKPCVLFYSSVL